jgi:hypothetical protein
MPDMHENGSGESRLDRMERMMAELAEGHVRFDKEYERLLEAQARLGATLERLETNRKQPPQEQS